MTPLLAKAGIAEHSRGLGFLNEVCRWTQPQLIPPLFQEALSGMSAYTLLFSSRGYPASPGVSPG